MRPKGREASIAACQEKGYGWVKVIRLCIGVRVRVESDSEGYGYRSGLESFTHTFGWVGLGLGLELGLEIWLGLGFDLYGWIITRYRYCKYLCVFSCC